MRYLWLVLGCALLVGVSAAADQPAPATTAAPSSNAAVLDKLDHILANQDQVFKRLDAIDEELRIIKVRASQKH